MATTPTQLYHRDSCTEISNYQRDWQARWGSPQCFPLALAPSSMPIEVLPLTRKPDSSQAKFLASKPNTTII